MTSCGHTSANALNAGFASSLSASACTFAVRRWISRAIVGSAVWCAIQSVRASKRSTSATWHALDGTPLASYSETSASIDTESRRDSASAIALSQLRTYSICIGYSMSVASHPKILADA